MKFTESEKKIIKKIRQFIGSSDKVYNFRFIYDNEGIAINFEGGYELSEFAGFRNEYQIISKPGVYRITKTPLKEEG